jgi:hypothetical protein
MSLAGLCFTLADHEVLKRIWSFCKLELLPKKRLGNLDSILAVYILRNRYAFVTKEQYQLPENADDIEIHNYIMLGGGGGMRRVVRGFLSTLYRNPTIQDQICIHTTEIRRRLVALTDIQPLTDNMKLLDNSVGVLQDMRQFEQILLNVKSELIAEINDTDFIELDKYARQLDVEIKSIEECRSENSEILNRIEKLGNAIHTLLYGDNEGLVKKVGSQFLMHFKDNDEIDNNLVAKIVRTIQQKWTDRLKEKKSLQHNQEATARWQRDDGTIISPEIFCSANSELQDLWLYCDSFVFQALEDTLANVYHANEQINDPWFDGEFRGPSELVLAHLWWRVEREGDYALFKTANASANQKISLKQTVNFAGLERAGGRIEEAVKNDSTGRVIALITLRIPLHSAFFKENI